MIMQYFIVKYNQHLVKLFAYHFDSELMFSKWINTSDSGFHPNYIKHQPLVF